MSFVGRNVTAEAREGSGGVYFQPGTYLCKITRGVLSQVATSEYFGLELAVLRVENSYRAEDHEILAPDEGGDGTRRRFGGSNKPGEIVSLVKDMNMRWSYIAATHARDIAAAIIDTYGFELALDDDQREQLEAIRTGKSPVSIHDQVCDWVYQGDGERFAGLVLRVYATGTTKKVKAKPGNSPYLVKTTLEGVDEATALDALGI